MAEAVLYSASLTTSTPNYTEITLTSLSINAVLDSLFGSFRAPIKIVIPDAQTLSLLTVQSGGATPFVGDINSSETSTVAVEVKITQENLDLSTSSFVEEVLTSLSTNVVVTDGVGAYRCFKFIVLKGTIYGAFSSTQSGRYSVPGSTTLPVIPSPWTGHLGVLSQLFDNIVQHKIIVPPNIQLQKFFVFDTVSVWPGISAFSTTISGTTLESSDANVFTYHIKTAIRSIPAIQTGGFEADGQTNVSVLGSQISSSNINITAATNIVISGSKVSYGNINSDGNVTVSIFPNKLLYGPWEADGTTNVEITSIGNIQDGFEGSGSTDVEFTVERDVYAVLNMDGATNVQINPVVNFFGFLNANGDTSFVITAAERYTFDNIFNCDGVTNVVIVGNQAYGFGNLIECQGIGLFSITAQRDAVIGFECDGSTAVQFGSVADYFINIECDGLTTVVFNAAYYPAIQIVATGVGNCFINSLVGRYATLTMDGLTDVDITAIFEAAGFLQWYTGIGTSVAFGSAESASAFINCDGATDVSFSYTQDQYGEILIDQIDQEFYALGSFVFTDGAITPAINTSILLDSTYFPLGPDYISGIIVNTKDTGSPDFVPIATVSFTFGGTTSRSIDTGDLGVMNYERAVGPSRATENYNRMAMQNDTTEEYTRFPLFVSNAIDFTQINTTIGFTTDGISAVAGYGIVGRDKEEYVTLAILTNTRLTQETLELLATGNPDVDLTQVCYEILMIPTSNCLMTQVVEEVLYLANLGAIQSEAIETLAGGDGGSGYINIIATEALASIHADALMSQTAAEVLATGSPYARISQVTTEMLVYSQLVSFSNAWVNSVAIEAITNSKGNAVINSEAIEILQNGQGNANINIVAVEIINNGDPNAVTNSVVIEELNNSTTQDACIQGIAIECLVLFESDPTVASLVNNPRYCM